MLVSTSYVTRGEYGLALVEQNLLSPDYRSRRRYQIIYVVRDDNLAEYRTDLGPASDIPPFRILGGASDGDRFYFVHTVAELLDMADILREDTKRFRERMEYLQGNSTLIQDAIDQAEENRRIVFNKSQFGPGGTTQRNGFSRKGLQEHARRNR